LITGTYTAPTKHLAEIASNFCRLDDGNEHHLQDIQILFDLPDVLSIAKLTFRDGIGYEIIYSQAADADDLAVIPDYIRRCILVGVTSLSPTGSGLHQTRVWYWQSQ